MFRLEEPKKGAGGTLTNSTTPNAFSSAHIEKKETNRGNSSGPHGCGVIEFVTTLGSFHIELYWLHAPRCCENIYQLCKEGYYDNTRIHRIVRNFIIQMGDPTGTGRGGTSIYGDVFPDEIHPQLKHTGAGIVSMANSGPNTNNSQFFITLAPTPYLDGHNSIFGRISKGMEVVKKMSNLQTTKTDKPIADIKIIRTSTAQQLTE